MQHFWVEVEVQDSWDSLRTVWGFGTANFSSDQNPSIWSIHTKSLTLFRDQLMFNFCIYIINFKFGDTSSIDCFNFGFFDLIKYLKTISFSRFLSIKKFLMHWFWLIMESNICFLYLSGVFSSSSLSLNKL
jgi:hypothetical protein